MRGFSGDGPVLPFPNPGTPVSSDLGRSDVTDLRHFRGGTGSPALWSSRNSGVKSLHGSKVRRAATSCRTGPVLSLRVLHGHVLVHGAAGSVEGPGPRGNRECRGSWSTGVTGSTEGFVVRRAAGRPVRGEGTSPRLHVLPVPGLGESRRGVPTGHGG